MFTFLTSNKYNIALPLSTVKYTVEVTKHLEQKPEEIEALIKDISKWVEKRSSTNNNDYKKKLIRYLILPRLFGKLIATHNSWHSNTLYDNSRLVSN